MILWLFYGRNFKEKFKRGPRIFKAKNSEEFRRNPTRRNETTRVRFLTLNGISFPHSDRAGAFRTQKLGK